MQYLHLVYLSDRMLKPMHQNERWSHAAAIGRSRRQPVGFGAGTCNGNSLVTDGPFVETKEYRI